MTPETLDLCRDFVTLCEEARRHEELSEASLTLLARILPLWHELNRRLARDYSAPEMWNHCNVVLEAVARMEQAESEAADHWSTTT